MTQEVISSLHDEWSDLADHAIERNVFLHPWFIRASIPLLEPQKPLILTLYQGDTLIGLTIMQADYGYARLPVGFYRTCRHYHQFLATPLIRQGNAEEFFVALMTWLDGTPSHKSFCMLDLISGDGEIARAADGIKRAGNRETALVEHFDRAAIIGPVPQGVSPDDHISKSRLKSLRRRRTQLDRVGTVCVEAFAARDCAQEWLTDFMRLENSGWKHEGGTSIAENPPDTAFFREMVAGAAAKNALSFLRLTVDGTPIAYTLDLHCGPDVYCLKSAHDAEWRAYAPGVALEHETLRRYYRPDSTLRVDSCTSPENEMLNALWPHRKKIVSLAFAKRGRHHAMALRSTLFLKTVARRTGFLDRMGK